jgi:hypothetical protein
MLEELQLFKNFYFIIIFTFTYMCIHYLGHLSPLNRSPPPQELQLSGSHK